MNNTQAQVSTWLTDPRSTPADTLQTESSWQAPRRSEPAVGLPAGTTLNGVYRILEVVGRGGMGIVYRAVDHLHDDRVVALKTIRPDVLTPQQVTLFKAEFQTLTELHHPNVAAAYDFAPIRGTDGAEGYLFTMEYVEGRNIYDATSGASWSDVLNCVVPVCRALAYIHSRHLIHFDLKPPNVLVDVQGTVKILDFGVAALRRAEAAAEWRGTLHYMAPELANRDMHVDHRADLYSLGIMLYQLLYRRLPFDARSARRLVEMHHIGKLAFPADAQRRVPGWLQTIVGTLCAKLPADRYRSANAIIDEFNRQGGRSDELETKQTRESYILSSRFVGRDAERTQATRFVMARVRGEPKRRLPALFIAGPSGVGKSRLLREVRLQAQLAHISFLEGSCYEGSFAEYGPVLAVIEHLIRLADSVGHGSTVERYGPELIKLHPAALANRGITVSAPLENGELERQRLLDHVTEFAVRVADVAPYVICVDDLQWAAAGTVDLLTYLIRRIALAEDAGHPIRCALLASFRDDETQGRPLETMLDQLAGQYQSVSLPHLDNSQVARLLGSMLGIDHVPEPFVKRVAEETAGNPFFVEEVMRTLIENGSVYLEQDQWAARERVGELPIPSSIETVFRRRASLLEPGPRSVLDLMSVHGQPIPLDLLQAASGLDFPTLHGYVTQLHHRYMVKQVGSDTPTYALLHDRMREIVYADLGDDGRRIRHCQIGEILERRSDGDTYVNELAHHFWQARESDRAFIHCLRAGERAQRGYANERAIEFFQRVLDLLPEVKRKDSSEIEQKTVETLGDLYTLQGKYADAVTRYESVLTATPRGRSRARLLRKLGQVHWQKGELAEAASALWNAAEQLGDSRPRSTLAKAVATLSGVVTHLGHRVLAIGEHQHRDPEERARLLELTSTYFSLGEVYFFHNPSEMLLPIVRASNSGESAGGDSGELAVAYSAVTVVYGTMTLWKSAGTYARRLGAMAERLASDWHIGIGHAYSLILHYYRANWSQGIDAGYRARDLLLRCGDMVELSFVYWLLALCHYYRGHLQDALAIATEGIATMERADSQQPSKGILAVAARVRARLGDHESAKALIARSGALCRETHDRFFSAWVEMMKGDCHLIAGELDEARVCLENARTAREAHGLLPEFLVEIYPLLASAMLEQFRAGRDRFDAAERRYRLNQAGKVARTAMRLSKRRHCYYAPSLRVAATAAFLGGEEDRGQYLFARSLAHARRVGAPLQLGETHLEIGRCLIEAKRDEQARGHFRTALAVFEDAQAHAYILRAAPHVG